MTASWLEILWTAVNLLGAMGAVRLTLRTVERQRVLLRQPGISPTGPRAIAAARYTRNILLRLTFHAVGIAVGIWAMVEAEPTLLFTIVTSWALIAMAGLFTIASAFDVLDETHLDRLLRESQRPG